MVFSFPGFDLLDCWLVGWWLTMVWVSGLTWLVYGLCWMVLEGCLFGFVRLCFWVLRCVSWVCALWALRFVTDFMFGSY